jgi:peptidoglycan-associated lipoprotein
MRKNHFLFASLSLVIALLAGCPSAPRPDPSQTVFKSAKPSADWIDPTRIYGAGAEGLTIRDENFVGADSQRDERTLAAATVFFDTDKSSIATTERPKIDDAAKYLKDNPQAKLMIEGYCDWRGTRQYNLGLGDRRAAGVKQRLLDSGIDAARIQTLSHGDLLAKEGVSADEMKEDRRAAFVVVR